MSMRNQFIVFGLAFMVLLLNGCSRFTRTFQGVAWECGLREDEVSLEASYIKFLKPDQSELSGVERATTRARYISSVGTIKPLELTQKACVQVPSETGTLQISNINPGLQASLSFAQKSRTTGFERVNLQKHTELQAELICPDEGYFAHDSLPFPARLLANGSLQATRIRILAIAAASGREQELFRKDYGQDVSVWPDHLLTKNLPEGSYNLSLEIVQSSRGWDLPLSAATGGLCPLQILHREPGIKGLTRLVEPMASFVKKGETFSWTSESEFGRLFVCRESKAQDADELTTEDSTSCEPQAECKDSSSFKAFSQLTATDAGVFDYFLYAQDRSGRRSDMACQRIIVSDQKPTLRVRWEEASWNQAMAVMASPKAGFAATIEVSHQQRSDRNLASQLQCRVDFMVDTATSMAGRDVLCTSGRCRGMRMDRFVPCDTNVEASLYDFWSNQMARPLLMRLHVRADDGSGHWAETMRSVWIHPQRWQQETMPPFAAVGSDEVTSLTRDRQGNIFTVYRTNPALWDPKTQTWKSIRSPLTQPFADLKVFASEEGEVFLTGLLPTSARPAAGDAAIARWNGQTWELLPAHPGTSECYFQVRPHPRGGFWCEVDDVKAIHFKDGSWSEIDFPKDKTGNVCNTWGVADRGSPIVASRDGGYWMVCYTPGVLYHRTAEGIWDEKSYELPSLEQIAEDGSGRLWTLQRDQRGPKTHFIVGYVENGQWTKVATSDPKTLVGASLIPAPGGSILYYDMQWNQETKRWERLPGLDRYWPDMHLTAFYTQDKRLMLSTRNGFASWNAGDVSFYPVSWFDLEPNVLSSQLLHFSSDGDFWFRAALQRSSQLKLRRIRLRPWNSFGVDTGLFLRSEGSIVGGLWFNDAGLPLTYIGGKGLFEASDAGWKNSVPTDLGWIAGRDGAGNIFVSTAHEVYRTQGESLHRLIEEGKLQNSYTFLAHHTKDQRVWAFRTGTRFVWRLGAGQPEEFFLPENTTLNEVKDLMGRLVAFTSNGIMAFDLNSLTWKAVSYEDLGLPADTDYAIPVSSEHVLVKLTNKTWVLRGLAPELDRVITPPVPDPYMPPSQLIVIKENDYLIFVQNRGMFRGDGQRWTPLLTDKDVARMMPGIGEPYFTQSYLDPLGRVWLTGKPFRLMMFELPATP